MSLAKKIFKVPLDILAFLLQKSPDAIYYLVKEPLKGAILHAQNSALAYQHIENACNLAQSLPKNVLQKGIILDVGGGQATTAEIFSRYFPNQKVYIFEPIKHNIEAIEKASSRTLNWNIIHKAVGNQVGTTFINIAQRVTASSLLDMNANAEGYGDILQLQNREAIELTTLDHEIRPDTPVLILKMDVQGFELEVLRGGIETLKRTQIVIVEINNHDGYKNAPTYYEIDEFLRQQGFVLQDLLPNIRINGKLQDWDAIYIKK
jgi:FkbM family methyltransferase